MAATLPHYPYSILPLQDDQWMRSVRKICKVLRPHWKVDGMQFNFLSGGYMNKTLCCLCPESEAGENERLLFRITLIEDEQLINRKAELEALQLMHDHCNGSHLYCTFANGLVCSFLPGSTLNPKQLADQKISRLISNSMASMHALAAHVAKSLYLEKTGEHYLANVMSLLVSKTINAPCDIWNRFRKLKFPLSKAQLAEEHSFCSQLCLRLKSEIVFCHNDLNMYNMIYNGQENAVHLIDVEFAGLNYQAFDIANHFCEFAGILVIMEYLYGYIRS
ncbi:unnamed protein product [Soboliphyme baturini]|uniref:ethanolamine kinase n=1 Tax=Soboliphyme baturini TaxID=241478 RepID=A0A183ICI7_9BILA|nr:unnamed protein product [Soboliphyme baturini]